MLYRVPGFATFGAKKAIFMNNKKQKRDFYAVAIKIRTSWNMKSLFELSFRAIVFMALWGCVNPASAATPVVQIQTSYDSNKCIDIFQGSTAPHYGVDLFTCQHGDPHELFAFLHLVNGNYKIVPQSGSALCVDAKGIPASDDIQAVQNLCSPSLSQEWNVHENGDGTFSILTIDGMNSLKVEGNNTTDNRARILVKSIIDNSVGKFYLPGFASQNKAPDPAIAVDGNRSIGPVYIPALSLIPRAEVPKGTVINFTMKSAGSLYFSGQSEITGTFSRQVWVYVPKQYIKGDKVPFMVSQDAAYRQQLTTLLDNNIYDKKLPVMVIIFADNGGGANGIGIANDQGTERNLEYDTLSARYSQWVQNELLPRVEAESRSQIPDQAISLTPDPEGRGAIGCSSGAAAAFTMAWFQPDFFRKVISYSGSYTNLQYPTDPNYPHGAWSYPEELIKNSSKKPLRIWFEAGTQDMDWSKWGDFLDWQKANRILALALANKGYHYHFDLAEGAQHCDGRVPGQTLPEAMQWLWKDYPLE